MKMHRKATVRAAALLVACAAGHVAADPQSDAQEAGGFSARTGEALYASVCQGCHMEGGKGAEEVGHYPALAGNPTVASEVYVMQMVMYGNKGMPGFAGFLSDDQVAAVVDYVRSDLDGNAYDAGLDAQTVADARDPEQTDPLE